MKTEADSSARSAGPTNATAPRPYPDVARRIEAKGWPAIPTRRPDDPADSDKPLRQRGKRPSVSDWTNLDREARAALQRDPRYAGEQTGILTGHGLIAIDVDIDDRRASDAVNSALNRNLWDEGALLQRGKVATDGSASSRFVVPLRMAGEIGKVVRTFAASDDQRTFSIEILARGQQFIAAGYDGLGQRIHWHSGLNPTNTHVDELPEVTADDLEALLVAMEDSLETVGYRRVLNGSVATTDTTDAEELYGMCGPTDVSRFEAEIIAPYVMASAGLGYADRPWGELSSHTDTHANALAGILDLFADENGGIDPEAFELMVGALTTETYPEADARAHLDRTIAADIRRRAAGGGRVGGRYATRLVYEDLNRYERFALAALVSRVKEMIANEEVTDSDIDDFVVDVSAMTVMQSTAKGRLAKEVHRLYVKRGTLGRDCAPGVVEIRARLVANATRGDANGRADPTKRVSVIALFDGASITLFDGLSGAAPTA